MVKQLARTLEGLLFDLTDSLTCHSDYLTNLFQGSRILARGITSAQPQDPSLLFR
jgi:hypothetical protein